MKTYKHSFLHICITLISCLMLSTPLYAASAPEILRLDTIMQENEVRITVAWNSEVPVVKIIASGGKSTQEIESTDAEPIINRRTPQGGYTGSKSFILQSKNVAVVKSYKSEQFSAHYTRQGNSSTASASAVRSSEPYQEVVVVTVQLIDKYATESALIRRDVPTVVELAAQPAPAVTSAEVNLTPTQNNNQINTQPQSTQDAILNAGMNVANQMITEPNASIVDVQATDGKIVIIASAKASKPIQQFSFDVIDTQNNGTVFNGKFDCTGSLECKDRRGETVVLKPGNYDVLVKMKDGAGKEATAAWAAIPIIAR